LLYVQFWDVYLIQFIPFAVFAVAQMSHVWPRWCKASTAVLALVMLCVSSLWTRGNLSKAEASWQAAEIAHAAGAAPESIGGNMTWSSYHGAFDEWISHVGGQDAAGKFNRPNPMHDAFFEFLRKRYDVCHQRSDATKTARGDDLTGNFAEEALDQVEPG
jgi:hypothetical protein